MLDFFMDFTVGHTALLLSILALLASVRANSIAQKSLKHSKEVHSYNESSKIYGSRTEILKEIDTRQVKLGSLKNVLEQKISLFTSNSELAQLYPDELKRLEKRLEITKGLIQMYEKQRAVSEKVGDGADLSMQELSLAKIRQLTIHVEEELSIEEKSLNHLQGVNQIKA